MADFMTTRKKLHYAQQRFPNLKKKVAEFNQNTINPYLLHFATQTLDKTYDELQTSKSGLTPGEVETRQERCGKNEIATKKQKTWSTLLLSNVTNPFILVLITLGVVSYLTHDRPATLIVSIMVLISVCMRFIQEYRSSQAATRLRAMVKTYATVKRQIAIEEDEITLESRKLEVPFDELVPGDILYLSAGDMIPADILLIKSKDLFVSQSALTGESIPVEKIMLTPAHETKEITVLNPLEHANLCFMGTSVASGSGKGIILTTGLKTHFGSMANSINREKGITSFDRGIDRVTWLLIRFILIMVPIIFFLNGLFKHDWQDAFLFAISVAVGLTPEMLPMIVTANLAKGAVSMSKQKVIVKRLHSIQNLGAMNILCTDKTGTLTQDRVILDRYLDIHGEDNVEVLHCGFLNSYYQTGLKNMLDRAVLDHVLNQPRQIQREAYTKIDEIPFDFSRRRMSVVVHDHTNHPFLICKGAVEEILSVCTQVKSHWQAHPLHAQLRQQTLDLAHALNQDGFRVLAVAVKEVSSTVHAYSAADEHELTLLGLMAFLDPPKETAAEAIQLLHANGIAVKILTGDNEIVTKRICQEVGLTFDHILLGHTIELLSDAQLGQIATQATVFAKLSPLQKARIVNVLKAHGHTVGFLGDGINDAAALREADVGISVDSATDIARESADIILLEKSLLVLREGVIKGREVYGNIIKYIKMTVSSNFGNVISVLIASAFLPFLPMLPLQLLIQNLFYDISQLSLPWDRMDKKFLKKPRKWNANGIFHFSMIVGPISSLFDITTFLLLWFVYQANSLDNQNLFQTGWFMEGLLSQTLIVHMIRTKMVPFIQSTAALPVVIMTAVVMVLGLYLPYSSLSSYLNFTPLPFSYFSWLGITLLAYFSLMHIVKVWYIHRYHAWL